MDLLEGRNPVIEALKNKKKINKILVHDGNTHGAIKKVMSLAKLNGVPVLKVDKNKLNKTSETNNHQGVIAYVPSYEYYDLTNILEKVHNKSRSLILLLDGIQDPHNLGAIIRTADATGVDAVIIPKDRAVGVTPIVAKTAVGAIEHVPVCKVTNISRTIDELKDSGYWLYAADMDGEQTHFQADLKGKVVLVIGSEGNGIRRLTKEKCDVIVTMPMLGNITSLNASVAASVLMYEVLRQNYGTDN